MKPEFRPLIPNINEALSSGSETGILHILGQTYNFGDISSLGAVTRAELANSGVKAGDLVAVLLPTSLELLLTYLATLSLRAVYMPLNPGFPSEQIKYMLEHSQAKILVTNEDLKGKLEGFTDDLNDLQKTLVLDIDKKSAVSGSLVSEEEFSNDDVAMLIYTSGTTGDPKGAMITSGNLSSNVQALIRTWKITASDRLLLALPLFHMHGLGVALNSALITGCTTYMMERFDAEKVLDFIEQEKISLFMGVPTMYFRMLEALKRKPVDLSFIRLFISGSAPLSSDLFHEFKRATGHEILERYGLTETVMNTSNPFDGERIPGSAGLPVHGVDVKVADADGNELPVGEVGEVMVRGPNVFKGYWKNEAATRNSFCGDYFATGDLGKRDSRGYLYLVGRKKELIILGGYNIYPREVEEVLETHPSVKEAAVFGVEDRDMGEKVCAAVVLEGLNEEPELLKNRIVSYLRERVVRYKIPGELMFLEEIPRNAMGKIVKDRLKMLKTDNEGTSG